MLHIHLDPAGGIAGDMFAAALLHALPAQAEATIAAASALAETPCRIAPHRDGALTGLRFVVDDAHHHHHHAHWADIRTRIERSALPEAAIHHATGIFQTLAEAEARIHGVPLDDVAFHEVGAADSIADITAAAWLIAAIGPATWSVGSLPTGSGLVRTAHGLMPVPAPATALLLEGFALHDDGIPGERVTPTGAAILRHLGATATRPPGTLRASGYGMGTRSLPGMANCLRALVMDTARPADAPHRELAVISFEVDDQSGEDLATGLDHLRRADGVHDVVQMPAIGKKGRMAVHIQVLARPDALDAVVQACFDQTTTIGLRTHLVQGRALARSFATVDAAGHPVQIKRAHRPGGVTAKAEADHLAALPTHAQRTAARRLAEAAQ